MTASGGSADGEERDAGGAEAGIAQGPRLRARLLVAALAALVPLAALGVGLIVAFDSATESARGGLAAVLAVWALAVLAGVGAAGYVGWSILRPLRGLHAQARQPSGSAGARLPVWREDEIGDLARVIADLRRRHDQVRTELAERTARDPETGFLRPVELRSRLDQELARGRRHGHELAVVLVAVDPQEGEVPTAAAALRAAVRPTDVLGSLDDATFAVMLPETGADGALVVAGRIRSGLGPTLSGTGAAVSTVAGHSADQLLQAARDALDQAREGDGAVHLYGES